MTATDSEIERLESMAIGAQGSYSELSIDTDGRSVQATIIWNPRRMLRDQLLLDGWQFDESSLLLPFSQTEFQLFVQEYIVQILQAATQSERETNSARLKRRMPEDLYGLLFYSLQTTRVPFDGIVMTTFYRLIHSSLAGYTLATITTINQTFDNHNLDIIKDVYDLNMPGVQILYKQEPWSLRNPSLVTTKSD